jgi:hypothetical protein
VCVPPSGVATRDIVVGDQKDGPSISARGAERAEYGRQQRRLDLLGRQAPGAQLGARGVNERHQHREVPTDWHIVPECLRSLAAVDQRLERAEDGAVSLVKLGLWKPGVDRHEGVVAPERAPRS